MPARMQELLRLLGKVVEHVRAAADRAARAEAQVAEMTRLLDALAAENADLRADLDRGEAASVRMDATIRRLREMLEDERRASVSLEARAAEAEQRIARAVDALGAPDLPTPAAALLGTAPSVALH